MHWYNTAFYKTTLQWKNCFLWIYELCTKCNAVLSLSRKGMHGKLLSLTGRLFSGLSMELLRTSSTSTSSSSTSDSAGASDASFLSAAISHEERLHKISSDVIDHCLKLLSIFCHILDETPVVIPTPKTSNLPSATSQTLTPLKKRQASFQGTTKFFKLNCVL